MTDKAPNFSKLKDVVTESLSKKILGLIEETKEEISQNLFEKGEWLAKTAAGGDVSKVASKGAEVKMEKDIARLGKNVVFKAPEIAALRKKGYVPAMEDDDMMLVSKGDQEMEEPMFTLMKYRSTKDSMFTYMLVYNMPTGNGKKYEIYTSIADVPLFKDAKIQWRKSKPGETRTEM